MAVRLAGALSRIKQLEAQIGGLQNTIAELKMELVEANKERKILSRKVPKEEDKLGYGGK